MTKLKQMHLAHYDLVNDLSDAHLSAPRLYNILDRQHRGPKR